MKSILMNFVKNIMIGNKKWKLVVNMSMEYRLISLLIQQLSRIMKGLLVQVQILKKVYILFIFL